MRKMTVVAALLCIFIFAGCNRTEEGQDIRVDDFTSMEEEPDISYEVPESTPGILADRLGYLPGSAKIVIFQGEQMPEEFWVVDAESKETVYTGILEERGYNRENREYNSYGDFTALTVPGTYYIEAPILGRSYDFEIARDVYDAAFKEACRKYRDRRMGKAKGWRKEEKEKSVCMSARVMAAMMLAFELHRESFGDDTGIPESGNGMPDILDEIKYETEWLFQMQDQDTGEIGTGTGSSPAKALDFLNADFSFAMVMARYSYLYQEYDEAYAASCLAAAERAFSCGIKREAKEADSAKAWKFAAAAELYRATGKSAYHRQVTDFISTGDSLLKEKNEIILQGFVTYISTRRKVKMALCEEIMETLLFQGEEISDTARRHVYLISEEEEKQNDDRLLLNMMYMGVINHIIENYEYGTILENHLHYFLGRNSASVNYIEGIEGKEALEEAAAADANTNADVNANDSSLGLMDQFEANSKLIFLLSAVVGERARHGAISGEEEEAHAEPLTGIN